MNCPKRLNSLTKEDFLCFLNSFDYVLSDVDGVLLLANDIIKGSDYCIQNFRKLDKKLAFVTNTTFSTSESIKNKLKPFEATEKEIITPTKGVVAYLNNIKFDRSLYLIGSSVLKEALKESGFELVDFEAQNEKCDDIEAFHDIILKTKCQTSNIGAILSYIETSCSYLKLNRALNLLISNPDIMFITAGYDDYIPIGNGLQIPAARCYNEAIKKMIKRESIILAKPGHEFGKIVNKMLKISDPKRVLFIGDSIPSDMQFAANCGYQKLLVLSGSAKEENLRNWTYPGNFKPQYYVNSLNDINLLFWKYNILSV